MYMRFTSRSRCVMLGLTLGFAIVASGCGDKGRVMTKVSGNVTLDGVPVNDGQILFRLTTGEQKGYEAMIKDGTYHLECEPGDAKIEITAFRIVPGKFTTVNGPKEPVREMYIPEKYNSQDNANSSTDGVE